MSDPLFEEGAFVLAKEALRNARDALVAPTRSPEEKRRTVAALLAIPWSREFDQEGRNSRCYRGDLSRVR